MAADVGADALRSCNLGPKAEEAVLKSGIVAICEAVGSEGLLNFPKRPNGSPVVMRQGFFERLLRGEVSLQDCTSADASAAESDVKRLDLRQLLAIRCKHLDFVPKGAGQAPKASFLSLVDRCIHTLLAQRLLGDEAKTLTDAHRALVMRHVVLIYGADRELRMGEEPFTGSECWLLAVRGTRRYLHLPRCEVSLSAPDGPVCCYRSHTAPNPKDPNRSRVFRWQVLLLENASQWTEDPLAVEASNASRLRSGTHLTNATSAGIVAANAKALGAVRSSAAAAAPLPAKPDVQSSTGPSLEPPETDARSEGAGKEDEIDVPTGGFMLFGDFDVEDLFDEFEKDLGSPTSAMRQNSNGDATSGPRMSATASEDIDDFFDSLLADDFLGHNTGDSPTGDKQEQTADVKSKPDGVASSVAPAESSMSAAVVDNTEPPTDSKASQPEASAVAAVAASVDGGAYDYGPPQDAAEAKLRESLEQFYRARKSGDKLGNVAKISRKWSKDGVVDLWASLGTKYSLPPPTAVQHLAGTLDARSAIGWPKNAVPASAQVALTDLGAEPSKTVIASSLRKALDTGDSDATSALAFCHGCPDEALRPRLWRALIFGAGATSSSIEADVLRERREAYRELRSRAESEKPGHVDMAEVRADASAAWRGEAFFSKPEAANAVANLVFTHAVRTSRYIRGSCEIAALLVFALCGGSGAAAAAGLAVAEADAFWCLSDLMAEIEERLGNDEFISAQAKRLHALLQLFDPPLAALLADLGLAALPALRIAASCCARGGFALADCVVIWDSLLADPQRFEFCDHVVVALLLLNRGELLQRDNIGSLAETLLAAPRSVDAATLLQTARAICAFQRRCNGEGRGLVYPPRTGAADAIFEGPKIENLDAAVSVAQNRLNSLWGKATAALDAGRTAAMEKAKEVDWAGAASATAARLLEAREKAAVAASIAATALEAYSARPGQDPQASTEDSDWEGDDGIPDDEARELAAQGPESPDSPPPQEVRGMYKSVIEEALNAPPPPPKEKPQENLQVQKLDSNEQMRLKMQRRFQKTENPSSEDDSSQTTSAGPPALVAASPASSDAPPALVAMPSADEDQAPALVAEQAPALVKAAVAASAALGDDEGPPQLIGAPVQGGPPQLIAAPALVPSGS